MNRKRNDMHDAPSPSPPKNTPPPYSQSIVLRRIRGCQLVRFAQQIKLLLSAII